MMYIVNITYQKITIYIIGKSKYLYHYKSIAINDIYNIIYNYQITIFKAILFIFF